MPEARYKVTTEGQIEDGHNPQEVQQRVTVLFKAPPDKISRLFSGKRVVIKENLNRETALKYQATLQRAGLVCRIARHDKAPEAKARPALKKIEKAPQTENQTDVQPIRPATPEEIYLEAMEPASLKPRLLAGLYTFFLIFCLYILLRLPIAAYLHFKYSNVFNSVEKFNGTTGALIAQMRQTNAISSELATYKAIALILVVVFLMVIIPMKLGRTWGQKKLGLTVLNRGNQIVRGLVPFILRLISSGVAFVTLGAVYLIPIVHPENKSLADLMSGTRQVQAGPLPKRPILTALFPFALSILLFLVITYPIDILLTPQLPTAEEIAAQKAKRKTKGAGAIPDFQITPLPLKPIRDCGPIIILHWQENPGDKKGFVSSYLEGLSGLTNNSRPKSMVLQLFKREEMRVVFADKNVEVCMLEPGKQNLPELFAVEEHRLTSHWASFP